MKVTIVRGDDWEGLYIDEKLVTEGHSLDIINVLSRLGIDCSSKWVDSSWLYNRGNLPVELKDVIFEK